MGSSGIIRVHGSGTLTLLQSRGESAKQEIWTPSLQQLSSRQTAQRLKPQRHFKERSWSCTTSQRTGVLHAEGSPMLAEFYKAASQLGVEIVFVSADQSEDAMFSYMKESHGNWFAIGHNSDLAEELNKKFKVEG